jgi:hypothetical protein
MRLPGIDALIDKMQGASDLVGLAVQQRPEGAVGAAAGLSDERSHPAIARQIERPVPAAPINDNPFVCGRLLMDLVEQKR